VRIIKLVSTLVLASVWVRNGIFLYSLRAGNFSGMSSILFERSEYSIVAKENATMKLAAPSIVSQRASKRFEACVLMTLDF